MNRSSPRIPWGSLLRHLLTAAGIVAVVGLLWHIGPARVIETLGRLQPATLVLVLLPSVLVYLFDTLGWRAAITRKVVLLRKLFVIRMAGEAVNLTTATGYVGGEPVKSYLLTREGVPAADAVASVVTAKTTMTFAQVVFMALGLALGWAIPWAQAFRTEVAALLAGIGSAVLLLVAGVVALVLLQRQGMGGLLLGLLRRLGLRIHWLENRAEGIGRVDELMAGAFHRGGTAFWGSAGWFALGWLTEGAEVYLMLALLDSPPRAVDAVALAALSVAVKASAFFIPGSIGVQEGGNLLLAMAYGYDDRTGMAFALLRRLREVVWIVFGFLCLAMLGKGAMLRQPVSPARD